MVSKPINLFHWVFLQILGLVILVFFDLIEWKLRFVGMNVVMVQKTIVIFYHQTHTWANEDPVHGACDPKSYRRC
jgi:hypothetical protein